MATAKEIAEFSVAFVVSEELVKNYIDHLKHLSYCKNLRTQETAQKRRARASKSYGDYNWEELLLTEGLNSLYVSELDLYLEESLVTLEKKLKKEKLELITTHLKETRAEALRTMTVTGQRLLQEPEAVSDDDDDDDDDDDEGNNTVLGETRSEESESEESECEESENEESESEEGDESEFEPLAKRPCSTRSGRHASSFIL